MTNGMKDFEILQQDKFRNNPEGWWILGPDRYISLPDGYFLD